MAFQPFYSGAVPCSTYPFFASVQFKLYLSDRRGKIDEAQDVFVRLLGNLNHIHAQMLQQLFRGRFYIEWRILQPPLPGNATVYLITGEDDNGNPYRPCIVKIDGAQRSASEMKNLDDAKEILGSIVPNVLQKCEIKGQVAVVLEYATNDNKNYSVLQFADFFRERSASEISSLLGRVFGQALYPFYRKQNYSQKSVKQMYFLPRLHQGEYEQISEVTKRSAYYQADNDTILLASIEKQLPNPGSYLKPPPESSSEPDSPYGQLFLTKRQVGLCLVHGDINPRNVLVQWESAW